MDTYRIPRLYGKESPRRILLKDLNNFIKVENSLRIKLKPAEEFTLYLLRLHYNNFSSSQGAYGDIMGVASNRISTYINSLQKKGLLKINSREKGRGKFYTVNKPIGGWLKIPKSFIKNSSIDWEDRLFIIRFYRLVLDDVNEIHYTDKEIASKMNYSEPTFRKFRDALLKLGLIEKLPSTYKNPNGGYSVDVYSMFGLNENLTENISPQLNKITSYRKHPEWGFEEPKVAHQSAGNCINIRSIFSNLSIQ